MKNFEVKGVWWLPQSSNNQVAGILKYDPKIGATLELIGTLNKNNKGHEIVLGVGSNNKLITLHNCFEKTRNITSTGLNTSSIHANYVFVGDRHYEKTSSLKFHKAIIRFQHLDEWLNKSEGFKIDSNHLSNEITINYKLPEAINVEINNNISLKLNPVANAPGLSWVQKDANISQKIYAVLESTRKKKFSYWADLVWQFQQLLTLLAQRDIYPVEYHLAHTDKNNDRVEKTELYFQNSIDTEGVKNLLPMDFLAPYFSIKTKFEAICKSWFNSYQTLETCYNPFFNTYYSKNRYTSDQFLDLAKAIEAFHRDAVGDIDPSTGKPYHYKKRVVEVFTMCSRSFNGILKIRDKNKFAIKIKDYRNDFTHSNPMLINRKKKYLETHYISESMKIILSCAILKHHGLTINELRVILNNSRLYSHLKFKQT
jgi:hypothetical protein